MTDAAGISIQTSPDARFRVHAPAVQCGLSLALVYSLPPALILKLKLVPVLNPPLALVFSLPPRAHIEARADTQSPTRAGIHSSRSHT